MKQVRISVYDIVIIGMMTAALESAKMALSFFPNVELVTLLIRNMATETAITMVMVYNVM